MPRVPRVPNPPGHQNAVGPVEQLRAIGLLERLGFDPLDVDLQPMVEAAVVQRLIEALVGILVADILADDVNGDLVLRILDALHERFPRLHVLFGHREAQMLQHDPVEPFGAEHERDFVNRRDVLRGDDRFGIDVAEQRDLLFEIGIEEPVGAAEQNVGLDADRAQVADAVLRRLRLQLAGRADKRHERQMDVERVLAPDVLAELADGLEERQAFDVADRAADFDKHDVDVGGDGADAVLDLVGDVGNHLDGAPQIIAAALLLNHRLVDLAGRPVVVSRRLRVGEALVVAQIEVGLCAVIGDVDLAVLVGAHRPGIDVDVRVEFLQRDPVAVPLEQGANRGRREPLAQARRRHRL